MNLGTASAPYVYVQDLFQERTGRALDSERGCIADYTEPTALGVDSQPSTRAIISVRLLLPVLSSMLFMWSWTVDT